MLVLFVVASIAQAVTLSVSNVRGNSITLTWTAASIPPAQFADYRIWRTIGGSPSFAIVHTETNLNTLTWTDTSVAAATTYTYRIYIENVTGSVVDQSTTSVTTPRVWDLPLGISPGGWLIIIGLALVVLPAIIALPTMHLEIAIAGIKVRGTAAAVMIVFGAILIAAGY